MISPNNIEVQIRDDNDNQVRKKWYEVIWYIHKKHIYSCMYPSNNDILVHMIWSDNVLVNVGYENKKLILL